MIMVKPFFARWRAGSATPTPLLVALYLLIAEGAIALSSPWSSASSPRSVAPSENPWAPGDWQITLEIGKTKNKFPTVVIADAIAKEMPEEWGESGAKLVLSFDVMADRESYGKAGPLGERSSKLIPQSDATYVSTSGEQTVKFLDGGWRITFVGMETSKLNQGHAATLNWWLDIEEEGADISRNDVSLPRPCRLMGSAPCWREPALEEGRMRIRPLTLDFEDKQAAIDKQVSHESGDRRLDGNDIKETIMAFKDMAILVQKRDEAKRKLKEAQYVLPEDRAYSLGPWPGTTDRLAIGKGVVTMVPIGSDRSGNILSWFGAKEMSIVGSWTAIPVEYEEYDDEDEEENDRILSK